MSEKIYTEVWTLSEDDVVEVQKESKQIPEEFRGLEVVEPRYSFADMLYFMDVSVWHKRCVLKKAALVAGLGWTLTTEDDDKNPDEAYNRIMALLSQPNSNYHETFSNIIVKFMQDYFSLGNSWIEVARTPAGEIAEIYHVPGRTVRRKNKFNGWWQVRTFSKVEFAEFEEQIDPGKNQLIYHFAYDPNDDYYGIPEWLPAMASMALDRGAVEYNSYQFQNGMMASFAVLIQGGEMSKTARAQLKKFLKDNFTQIKNAGRVLVISNDDPNAKIEIKPLDLEGAAKDMSFVNLRSFSRDEIIAAHDVPPRMVGIMAAGQLGGSGEISGQLKTFKETVINPEQNRLEDLLTNTILKTFGEHKWRIKFGEMDITDPLADAEYYQMLLNTPEPVYDVDEVRQEIGLPPRTLRPAAEQLEKHIAGALRGIRKALENMEEESEK